MWSFDDGKKLRRSVSPRPPGSSYLQFEPSGFTLRDDPSRQLRHRRALEGPRRRRPLRADPLSERHARRRAHLLRRARAAARVRARLQRVVARLLQAVRRTPDPAGDHPDHRRRRRDPRAQWAIKSGHKGALIATFPNGGYEPKPDGRTASGRSRRRPSSRSASTSAASATPGCSRRSSRARSASSPARADRRPAPTRSARRCSVLFSGVLRAVPAAALRDRRRRTSAGSRP